MSSRNENLFNINLKRPGPSDYNVMNSSPNFKNKCWESNI